MLKGIKVLPIGPISYYCLNGTRGHLRCAPSCTERRRRQEHALLARQQRGGRRGPQRGEARRKRRREVAAAGGVQRTAGPAGPSRTCVLCGEVAAADGVQHMAGSEVNGGVDREAIEFHALSIDKWLAK